MKEHPILFSTDMVKAILEGRKTMTRRVIKPQPTDAGLEFATACEGEFSAWQDDGLNLDEHSEDGGPCQRLCPYGQVGDRLWVRETYKLHTYDGHPDDIQEMLVYKAGGLSKWFKLNEINPEPKFEFTKWTHSIHMPRWASRINLEITEIRVERVKEISLSDAISEGVARLDPNWHTTAVIDFCNLWDSINAKRGYSWESNPWVWVISFKRTDEIPPNPIGCGGNS